MAKRFIDTGIFDDDWFMELPKDAKLLWLYLITKCDHAGIIKLNEKLCRVQTDIKDLETVTKQLGNRLVRLSEHLYFIPKFIEFQYPGFPNSKVRQQVSALEILNKYGLITNSKVTLTEELLNSYDNGSGNGTVTVNENGLDYEGIVALYHNLCPYMPKVLKLQGERKGFVNARVKEYGTEKLTEVLRKAGQSDFLNGKNDRAWKADFEWIMRPENFLKILEGKYSNRAVHEETQEERMKRLAGV